MSCNTYLLTTFPHREPPPSHPPQRYISLATSKPYTINAISQNTNPPRPHNRNQAPIYRRRPLSRPFEAPEISTIYTSIDLPSPHHPKYVSAATCDLKRRKHGCRWLEQMGRWRWVRDCLITEKKQNSYSHLHKERGHIVGYFGVFRFAALWV
ncbi:hypothetical protein BDR22DRAFT_211101 [Usnea florida]